jgi:hypothetical protein
MACHSAATSGDERTARGFCWSMCPPVVDETAYPGREASKRKEVSRPAELNHGMARMLPYVLVVLYATVAVLAIVTR